jgi:hypothetical protein
VDRNEPWGSSTPESKPDPTFLQAAKPIQEQLSRRHKMLSLNSPGRIFRSSMSGYSRNAKKPFVHSGYGLCLVQIDGWRPQPAIDQDLPEKLKARPRRSIGIVCLWRVLIDDLWPEGVVQNIWSARDGVQRTGDELPKRIEFGELSLSGIVKVGCGVMDISG